MSTVAYRAELATVFGCTNMALFASQCLYWMKNAASQARDGWFYKTRDEWLAETGLSRYRQESVRRRLRALGVLDEREDRSNWRTVKWYRINKSKLYALVNAQYDVMPSWCLTDLHDSTIARKGKEDTVDNTETGTDRAASGSDYSKPLTDTVYLYSNISINQYIKSINRLSTMVPNFGIEEVITFNNKKISETTKTVISSYIPKIGTIVPYIYRDIERERDREIERDRETEREHSAESRQDPDAVQPMHNPSLRTGTNVQHHKGQDAVPPQASATPSPGQPHALTTDSRRHGTDVRPVFNPEAFSQCHPLIYAFASSWLRHSARTGTGTLGHFADHGFTDHLSRLYLDAFDKERGHAIRRHCEQTLGWYPPLTDADLVEAGDVLGAMA